MGASCDKYETRYDVDRVDYCPGGQSPLLAVIAHCGSFYGKYESRYGVDRADYCGVGCIFFLVLLFHCEK